MMNPAAQANLSLDAYRQRRRNLAAEHKKELHTRHNVITGEFDAIFAGKKKDSQQYFYYLKRCYN